MTIAAIAILGVILLAAVVGYMSGWNVPEAYRKRPCQGRAWRNQFPDASKDQMREFLALFASAFGFRDRAKLQFAPSDRLMHIYRALYPSREMPDALELETLAKAVEKRYGIAMSRVFREDLTLGELFSLLAET